MRRLIVILLSVSGLSLNAMAAETGTYRPGQAYNSVTASSPSQCAAQCSGDAQCKGWNFIRPRQMSRTGVCEFNAVSVTPVPSPISISGDNVTARMSPRIIPGGTNTVRIGAPSPVAALAPSPQKVVSQPAPAIHRFAAQQAPQQRSQPRTAPATPQFRYSLDSGAPAAQSRPAHPQVATTPPRTQQQMAASQQRPVSRFAHSLDGGGPQNMPSPQQRQALPVQAAAAPMGQYAAAGPQARPLAAPRAYAPAPAPAPSSPVQMRQVPVQTTAQAQQSLFGSLYDDVTVPLTLTRENMPTDPDAPIATVRSVRTHPTENGTLAMMAGAPRL